MSDRTAAQPLNGEDTATLLFSLAELGRKTQELHDSLPDSAVKENLAMHIVCILSVSGKIEAIHQLDNRFCRDELRVIYIAVCELRKTVHAMLDAHASPEETRQTAFSRLKALNGLLRTLNAEIQRNGYALDEPVTSAYW